MLCPMPRARVYIESGGVYELSFRAKRGIPFVPNELMNFIIRCVLARVQRDFKIVICHHIWNGSHCHIIVVAKDARQLVNFLAETQKKLTEIVKRLLGVPKLNLWEGNGGSKIRVFDIEAIKQRIAYLYANPAQDNLVDSIEQFPGVSSWVEFVELKRDIEGKSTNTFPWIRLPSVSRLRTRSLTQHACRKLIEELSEANEELFAFTCYPNAWMKSFGIRTTQQVERINDEIIKLVRDRESNASLERGSRKVLGVKKLVMQALMQFHIPRKHGRKIIVIASSAKDRAAYLRIVRSFCGRCKDCYRHWLEGDLKIAWPPEAFKPPLPPLLNKLA